MQVDEVPDSIWINWIKQGFYGQMDKQKKIKSEELHVRIQHHRYDEYCLNIYEVCQPL